MNIPLINRYITFILCKAGQLCKRFYFRRFFFAVHYQEDLSFCKKEVLKKRIRFAIDCLL